MTKMIRKFGIVFLSVILFACSVNEPTRLPRNTEHWAQAVDRHANLYRIDDKLLRSEQLDKNDYELLRQNAVKTVINLRFFTRNDDKRAFGDTDLKLINIPLLTWAIKPKEVAETLWEIEKNQRDGVVLIHCYHGADRTGLISAMYRVIYQRWDLSEAKREMMQGPYGFHPVWKNIEDFFTQENVEIIKSELIALKSAADDSVSEAGF